MCNNLIIF